MALSGIQVAVNEEAGRLLAAAAVVRRHAGALRYHPAGGAVRRPGAEFQEAVARLRESLGRVDDWLPALESGPPDPSGDAAGREAHAAAQHLKGQRDLLRATLDVLERVLAHPERVPLDAPYGLGAPRRVHPGAQASWVAERAEVLARALATQGVLRANLAEAATPATR